MEVEPAGVELGSQIETGKMGGGTAGLHWRLERGMEWWRWRYWRYWRQVVTQTELEPDGRS